MTFQDDEIDKINKEKLAKALRDSKKHKNPTPTNNKDAKVVSQRPIPPVLAINSIISEVYEQSFPLVSAEKGYGSSLTPEPVIAQKILDTILNQYKTGMEKIGTPASEDSLKGFATTLLNIHKEIAYLGFVYLGAKAANSEEGIYTYILPKGIIYANSLNYVASANPIEHYLTYLQVAAA